HYDRIWFGHRRRDCGHRHTEVVLPGVEILAAPGRWRLATLPGQKVLPIDVAIPVEVAGQPFYGNRRDVDILTRGGAIAEHQVLGPTGEQKPEVHTLSGGNL